MARLKSQYRKFATGGAVPLHVEVNTEQAYAAADAATDHLLRAVEAGPPAATVDIDHNETAGDDASRAFQAQINALKESERIQRDRAQVAEILKANPAMVENATSHVLPRWRP